MNQRIFVGNYAKGIKEFELSEKQKFEYVKTIGELENNSYIVKFKEIIYSVIETSNGEIVGYKDGVVISNDKCGELPCFLTVDEKRNIIYIANYGSGSMIAYQIGNNGEIGQQLYNKKYENGSNIHHIKILKDKLYVINLGRDTLYEYLIKYDNGKLDLIENNKIIFPEKSEPRHMVIGESGNIFVVTERSCELYKIIHDENERLMIEKKRNILNDKVTITSDDTGCAIKIDNDNKYLYVSVRGKNCISIFDANTMKQIQCVDCEGNCPREICFDITGSLFLCANQKSNNISVFNVLKDGSLMYKEQIEIEKPSCIMIEKR